MSASLSPCGETFPGSEFPPTSSLSSWGPFSPPFAAIGVGSYIALAGLWASPVSGASMNTARSLGPALVLNDWTSWWAYLLGPILGALIAVGIAFVLRGPGGGSAGTAAAQGTLGVR